jgi:hypothetical protein
LRLLLNATDRRSVGVPTSSASARSGAAVASAATPGRSSAKSASLLARKGRIWGKSLIPSSSAGGPPLIESCRNGRATRARAPKVVSRLVNSSAWVTATGATIRAVRPSAVTKRPSCVRGSDSVRMTGTRLTSSGLISSIARLRSGPRPARPLPNSVRLLCDAARVLSSKVLMTSSSSTGAGVALRNGIVAPSS